ncbi:16S rRNA (cytosine1402-N4)-methyltransferase [Melghirimyces profundicolus]|uniref:Ribosomal RNA small subunit methyltransferase H n=1 Tax=Melghirimyces profundicolus TaxID=1242148 RepID=A0A2T6B590_9BACL|nr:16S rRNA (cytosine(1402)-N(4))-methyltransferase RsmH [Melghirimyces profundicolus]PTX51246.1 16S rRNA (cytosine1402-N4)-methyltransferase [Melghirimyces profundicolus]
MFRHETVMRQEAVEGLNIRPDGVYVDCTLGGAGHSSLITEQLGPSGILVGLDQDDRALRAASERLKEADCRVHLVKANFRNLETTLAKLELDRVDGVLFDLGVSSPQLDEAERGFSYHHDAPLDMRMDPESELTAADVVNHWSREEIGRILFRYGEERFARRIAQKIVEYRSLKPIESTVELATVIKEAIPAPARRKGPHPARRSFQAIRIAVNDELNAFEEGLGQAIDRLRPGGRVSVITFHSLEDRIAKQMFQNRAKGCVCPPDFPVCTCGRTPELRIITKKPVQPSEEETGENPRARSAKLRVAEKC